VRSTDLNNAEIPQQWLLHTQAFSRGVPFTLRPSGSMTLDETTVRAPLAKNCYKILVYRSNMHTKRCRASYSYHLIQLLAFDLLVTIPTLRSA